MEAARPGQLGEKQRLHLRAELVAQVLRERPKQHSIEALRDHLAFNNLCVLGSTITARIRRASARATNVPSGVSLKY